MERNRLDDHLKRSFTSFQSEVDLENLWSAIEPELPPEKKRRGLIFWLFLGSIHLILVFTITTDIRISSYQKTGQIVAKNDSPIEIQEQAIPFTEFPPNSTPSAISIQEDSEAITQQDLIITQQEFSKTNVILPIASLPPNVVDKITLASINPTKSALVDQVSTKDSVNHHQELIIREALLPFPFLLSGNQQIATLEISHAPVLLPTVPQRKLPQSKWALTIEQMMGIPNTFYTPLNNSYDAYAVIKEDSETPWWMTTTSISLSYQILPKTNIQSGLSIGWAYEAFNHSFTKDTIIQREEPTSFFVKAFQDTTFFNETVTVKETSHIDITHFNRYTMIQVPIGISYQFHTIGQQFEVGAGAIFNLNSKRDGKYLDQQGEIQELSTLQTSQNLRIGYYADLGIVLNSNGRFNYLVKIHSTYFPNNLTQQHEGLTQQYLLFGAKMGVRYRF